LIVTDPHDPNDVASKRPDYIPLAETYEDWFIKRYEKNKTNNLEKKLKAEAFAKEQIKKNSDQKILKKLEKKKSK